LAKIYYSDAVFENCYCNYSDGEEYVTSKPFKIIANDGYKFNTMTSFHYFWNGSAPLQFINAGSYLWIDRDITTSSQIKLTGTYATIKKSTVTSFYVLTNYGSFTNCYCNYNHGEFYDTEKPIKIIANEGYEFTNNYFTWNDGFNPSMAFKNNGDYLEITNFNENDLEYFMLDDDYLATEIITSIKVNLTGTFENCSCNYSDGELYNEEKQLKIIANEGYTFKDSYSWFGGVYTQNLINNTTYLSIPIELPSDTEEITLNDDYIATKKPKTVNTFTNIYLTNVDELNQLAIKRFDDEKDYSNFILNLYEIPFKIGEDISDVETTIKLGFYDTEIDTHLITERYVSFNLGSITVEEKYNNVYDYINTECVLYLPYFNDVYINNEYVINQTLEIEYIIDLYTNTCIANIKSSFSNEIVESLNTQIGNIIPFIQQNSLIGNFSLSFNNNKIPYVEVVRNRPYNVNTMFGGETIEYGKIEDYEGFIMCDKILLNSKANKNEKEEIKSLLKEGIII